MENENTIKQAKNLVERALDKRHKLDTCCGELDILGIENYQKYSFKKRNSLVDAYWISILEDFKEASRLYINNGATLEAKEAFRRGCVMQASKVKSYKDNPDREKAVGDYLAFGIKNLNEMKS